MEELGRPNVNNLTVLKDSKIVPNIAPLNMYTICQAITGFKRCVTILRDTPLDIHIVLSF